MPPGDCEILRPFVALQMGQPWEQPRPGVVFGREARREAGRAAGRRGQGFGTPCVRGLRHSLHARPPRLCRDIRALRESLSPLSPGEPVALPPAPCRPACVVSVLFVCWATCPGAAAPMAARGSLICVRFDFCSQIRDLQRFVTVFNI